MYVSIECEECGRHLRARAEDGGKRARCPTCGVISVIPVKSGPPPIPGIVVMQRPGPPPIEPPRPLTSKKQEVKFAPESGILQPSILHAIPGGWFWIGTLAGVILLLSRLLFT
jgi:hypothetical protein